VPTGPTSALLVALAVVVATPAAGQQPDIEASLHGLILLNAFHTTDNVNNSDVPQFAVPPSDASPEASTSSATSSPRHATSGLISSSAMQSGRHTEASQPNFSTASQSVVYLMATLRYPLYE